MNTNNSRVIFNWIETSDIQVYGPINQVYGVCFAQNGKVLIVRDRNENWQLPGGKPEKSEKLEETLVRECLEEANVLIGNLIPFGLVKVTSGLEVYYQARYGCNIKKLLPQKKDSCIGRVWERKLVPLDKIEEYIKWGEAGKKIFARAGKLFLSTS